MSGSIRVDDTGIHLPTDLQSRSEPIDVRFGPERIWSFNPARDGAPDGGTLLVTWPPALAHRLDGVTDVTLVPHAGGEVLFADEVRFGTSTDPLVLTDDDGNPLAVDKGGRLQRTFGRIDDESRLHLVEATKKVLDDLTNECGLDAYLAYGCLLGAVRDGKMIGHDSDSDVAFLSKYDHPFDIIRECKEAELKMRSLGWQIIRMSSANFKVWVPLPNGKRAGIDVFGSFHIGDHFHIMASLRGTLDRDAIVPFSTVTLEGIELPAPRDPERFLAFTYGPTWRVPDPAFHFDHPPEHAKMMGAWWRGSRRQLFHWQKFYGAPDADKVPSEPSLFAAWVEEQVDPGSRILDVGCGTGRDAIWFARQGHKVTALDYSSNARAYAKKAAEDAGVSLKFGVVNFESHANVLGYGAKLAHRKTTRHIYARGVLDALGPNGREGLWRFCSMTQRRGGRTFLEFRTRKSRNEKTFFGRHQRTFLDPAAVIAEIESLGGIVEEKVTGRNLAPLGQENPHICRLTVRWDQR